MFLTWITGLIRGLLPKKRRFTTTWLPKKCDIILGTREEFDMMERFDGNTEHSDQVTAGKWFDYSAKIVIIKHGKEGSIAYTRDGAGHKAKSFPAKVVKTFGAGDSYAAGFLYGVMQGWPIERCMEFGSAAACIVISSHSCSDAMPTAEQVHDYIDRCNRGEITDESVQMKGEPAR